MKVVRAGTVAPRLRGALIGTPMEPRNLDRAWHVVRVRAGLPWLRLHDLRHACATFLLASVHRRAR